MTTNEKSRPADGSNANRVNATDIITHIETAARLFAVPDAHAEVRAVGVKGSETHSGFYDMNMLDQLAHQAFRLDEDKRPTAIYITINPVDPLKWPTAPLKQVTENTKDTDILRRNWLPIDIDPVRSPAKSNATEDEKAAAMALMPQVREWLLAQGVPANAIISADSGNGAHILLAIDLPNDPNANNIVKRVLHALDMLFSNDRVKIDTSVGNAARIVKLYGTTTSKGKATPERPRRRSALLSVPDTVEVCPATVLEQIAATYDVGNFLSSANRQATSNGKRFDLPGWIEKHGLKVRFTKPWTDPQHRRWTLYILDHCPFNAEHNGTEARIGQTEDGNSLSFKCFHDSCNGNDWWALRDLLEPGWRDQWYLRSDAGNARRMADKYGGKIRYCAPWESWLVWDDKRLGVDERQQAKWLALETVKDLVKEAWALTKGTKEREDALKFAVVSEGAARIHAMLSLLQALPGVPIIPNELDRNPWLLNVNNGTLNLKTGELQPHRIEDLITQLAPVNYDPDAQCPQFEVFLDQIFEGNKALIDFVQRLMGYCLTGDVSEEILAILYGSGANGKTTFINTMMTLMGGYAKAAAPGLLMQRDREPHPTEQADLKGARFVSAAETKQGKNLDEETVKRLTGRDLITARRMGKDFFTFDPTHKIILATNYKPRIKGQEHGIWRRLRLIPFTVTIPEDKQDHQLEAKLKSELSGILNWALKGCFKWQLVGLQPPDEVKNATQEYRESEDIAGDFFAEHVTKSIDTKVSQPSLYQNYRNWAQHNGLQPMSPRRFNEEIRLRFNAEVTKSDGSKFWKGITQTGNGAHPFSVVEAEFQDSVSSTENADEELERMLS